MKFTFSHRMAIGSTSSEAAAFYRDVLGLEEKTGDDGYPFVDMSPMTTYLEESVGFTGPVFELLVEDVEAARAYLEPRGCKVLQWQGAGGACFIEDPNGVRFNLFQET